MLQFILLKWLKLPCSGYLGCYIERMKSSFESNAKINVGSLPEGLNAKFLLDKLNLSGCNVVHIAQDDKRLEAMKLALLFFDPNVRVRVIPAWDCSPYEMISPNPLITSERISSLSKINKDFDGKIIYLMTLNSVSQYLPPRSVVSDSYHQITLGKQIDEKYLKELLVQFGYVKTSMVSEPGDYSIRGDIIDIFTSGNKGAVRLDLFGDVVDRLRTIDPRTQLTISNLSNLELLPISEVIINETTVTNFRKNYRKLFGIGGSLDTLYSAVSNGLKVQGVEQWLPLFYNGLETIFDYLPKAIYFMDTEISYIHEQRWEKINEQYNARLNPIKNKNVKSAFVPCEPNSLYLSPENFKTCIITKNVFYLSAWPLPVGLNSINAGGGLGKKFISERKSENINLFSALNLYIKKSQLNTHVVITSFSEGSRDRLIDLLNDEGQNNIVKIKSITDLPKDKNKLSITVWPLNEGFYSNSLTIISEQDILGHRLATPPKKKNRSFDIITDALSIDLGDLIIHMDHGIGSFQGFETVKANGVLHECLLLEYAENSKLFLPVENIELLSRYGQNTGILDKLGGASWQKRKANLKTQILEMSGNLIKTAALRQLKKVKKIDTDTHGWEKFCSRFNYLETDDQLDAINEVINDLNTGIPMDRLICGDVGYGKTEVAMRAAFLVAMSGVQVAIISPTTLLTRQHFNTFLERFADFPINIKQLSRFTEKAEVASIRDDIKNGKVDIVIGTHSILSEKTVFSKLGLLIIDEEQHFGVSHKEKMKKMRSDIHVLTLTATPIPRTLHLSLSGLRDLSIIATPPIDRLAIRTYVSEFDPTTIRQALLREHYRGGQSFIVVPRIKDIPALEEFLIEHVPELSHVIVHGKISGALLDTHMNAFYDRKYDILLATTIIESGLDIPTANTIIIHNANMFGLAQLYQIRGRVGRSKQRAYAYLTTKPRKKLTTNAYKRLKVIGALTDLGAGFNLASQDLDLRGAGNILGDAQSGHIKEVGYELYQSLLEEAVIKMKSGNVGLELDYDQEWTPQLNLGVSILIPDDYVNDVSVRLELYKRLSSLSTKVELEGFASELIDRFGKLPKEINSLLNVMQIKSICKKIGISKIDLGISGANFELRHNHKLSPNKLINYINSEDNRIKVKGTKLIFKRNWVTNKDKMKGIFSILKNLHKAYTKK